MTDELNVCLSVAFEGWLEVHWAYEKWFKNKKNVFLFHIVEPHSFYKEQGENAHSKEKCLTMESINCSPVPITAKSIFDELKITITQSSYRHFH